MQDMQMTDQMTGHEIAGQSRLQLEKSFWQQTLQMAYGY